MPALPEPAAFLFDWDNTLVDTWPVIHEAMVATFQAMGHEPWTLAQTKERVRKSMRDAFPELFGDRWQEAGDIYQREYKAKHLEKLHPLAQSLDVLEKIKQRGNFCAVVSNKKGPTLRKEVEHMGWGRYFNAIVGSDDAARDKPHADPVLLALKGTPLAPSAVVWFVGDSDIDLECAQNTGCTPILYGAAAAAHEQYTPTHFWGMPFQAHVHEHKDLLKLLA